MRKQRVNTVKGLTKGHTSKKFRGKIGSWSNPRAYTLFFAVLLLNHDPFPTLILSNSYLQLCGVHGMTLVSLPSVPNSSETTETT